jgi:hypothetical protein
MPREARIEMCGVALAKTYAPGALHPIIGRGIERHRIFWDEQDRHRFAERLGIVLK